ncbi:uncharacterized protein LOC142334465 [Lycorma delicatula]|uniref:uncharacterized protein LOC142334465 n=1 Tax=Lycorma delicatula TaxID=130591 RepID=UPI003F515A91
MFISHKRDTKQNIVSFIQCVQKYPALYDYTLSSYRSDEQEKAWLEVANQMGENPATCKEKWKNLRACLCRHLRTQVNSTWKRPYYLAEHMKFVIPFTKYGRPDGVNTPHHAGTGVSDNEADDVDESKLETFYIKQEVEEESVEDPDDSNSLPVPVADFGTIVTGESNSGNEPSEDGSSEVNIVTASRDSVPPLRMKRSIQRIEPLERVQVEYLEENKKQKISSSYNDSSDLDFFRSLLPDIERMSHRQKIKFKLAVLGCVDNILYGQESDSMNTN